jgi:hypothetical protein
MVTGRDCGWNSDYLPAREREGNRLRYPAFAATAATASAGSQQGGAGQPDSRKLEFHLLKFASRGGGH